MKRFLILFLFLSLNAQAQEIILLNDPAEVLPKGRSRTLKKPPEKTQAKTPKKEPEIKIFCTVEPENQIPDSCLKKAEKEKKVILRWLLPADRQTVKEKREIFHKLENVKKEILERSALTNEQVLTKIETGLESIQLVESK